MVSNKQASQTCSRTGQRTNEFFGWREITGFDDRAFHVYGDATNWDIHDSHSQKMPGFMDHNRS